MRSDTSEARGMRMRSRRCKHLSSYIKFAVWVHFLRSLCKVCDERKLSDQLPHLLLSLKGKADLVETEEVLSRAL